MVKDRINQVRRYYFILSNPSNLFLNKESRDLRPLRKKEKENFSVYPCPILHNSIYSGTSWKSGGQEQEVLVKNLEKLTPFCMYVIPCI